MEKVPSILLKIAGQKEKEVKKMKATGWDKKYWYLAKKEPSEFSFYAAITKPNPIPNLIAEFKKASPSKGIIRRSVRPETIAKLYKECGACAISVLTDKNFKGEPNFLLRIREKVDLPLLRKDFIIDKSQIYESRYFGADAILLITSLLKPSQIKNFIKIADSLKMDCLVEAHNENELEKAVNSGARIIGINNRNLHDFSVDRKTTLNLLKYVPENCPIVTESGILNYEHVRELSDPRVNAMLVGESIMRAEDMKGKIYELLGRSDSS